MHEGILGAHAGTQYLDGEKGWRTSLALAALPALVLTIGSLILPETPNSLIERGHDSKACTITLTQSLLSECCVVFHFRVMP